MCNTVVSTETHQTTTNFAETMPKKNRYKLSIEKSIVNSEDPNQLASSIPPGQDLYDFHTTCEFVVIN